MQDFATLVPILGQTLFAIAIWCTNLLCYSRGICNHVQHIGGRIILPGLVLGQGAPANARQCLELPERQALSVPDLAD